MYSRSHKVFDEALWSITALKSLSPSLWESLYACITARTGKIVLTGVGKSGYVAMKVAATLTSLGQYATFIHPVEAMHGDAGGVEEGDVLIAFSYSGNTKELVQFTRYVRDHFSVALIGVTKTEESALGQLSDIVVPVVIRSEGCPLDLAPMASTTTMLVLGDAIAACITLPEVFTKNDFARFHPSGTLGLSLTRVHEKALMQSDMSVPHNTSLQLALQKMDSIGKGLIAVVREDGVLVGSVTDGDVRRFFARTASSDNTTVASVMNTTPKYVTPETSLHEALMLMETHKITNLFVVDDMQQPVGIIHIHDIVTT